MGLLLFILSQVLGIILFPAGILWGVVQGFFGHRPETGARTANEKFRLLAVSFDKYGNVVCADMFNRLLITRASQHRFGKIEHTISLVVGWNLVAGTLSPTGRLLNRVLNLLDPGHAIKTVEAYEKERCPL